MSSQHRLELYFRDLKSAAGSSSNHGFINFPYLTGIERMSSRFEIRLFESPKWIRLYKAQIVFTCVVFDICCVSTVCAAHDRVLDQRIVGS